MALKYKLEKLDGLDDSIKALYTEKNGAFYLDADGLPAGGEDVAGLKSKVEELLAEKKAEQDKARQESEKARKAQEDAAKKNGDFESLSKSYEEKIATLSKQLADIGEASARKEIARQANLIAAQISEGHNQEILATFIERRLRVEGDELKVTDEKGNLTISTIDQLKEEFKTSPKFGALVIASKGSGGGAAGSTNSSGAAGANNGANGAKQLSRSQFDALDASAKMEFSKAGGALTEN